MPASTTDTAVEREIAINASPETVWEFLVDPEKATRWMGESASLDARPGGEYRVEVLPGEVASGKFVEVDPPRRLVWTWGWEPGSKSSLPSGASTIEVELVPEGDVTVLRLLHRDLPDAEATQSHAHGWEHYLDRLETVARGDDPGRDPWLDSGPM